MTRPDKAALVLGVLLIGVGLGGLIEERVVSSQSASEQPAGQACAEAHSDYIARARAIEQCLDTPGCWLQSEDIRRMNQAQADAAAACPISVMVR